MKYLLHGVTIAAALVIAAPTWAQAPMTPTQSKTSAAPAAPSAAPMPGAGAAMPMKQAHHRHAMRHKAYHGPRRMAAGDAMTEQLNREELARLQGGAPPPPPMGMAPPPQGVSGPRPSTLH